MTCKLAPHPFAFFYSHNKASCSPRQWFQIRRPFHKLQRLNRDTIIIIIIVVVVVFISMTPQSSNESESDEQIVESELKKTHQSKDEEVQSILKPCSETNNDLELDQPESRKEEVSQSNPDSAQATSQLQQPSVTTLMEKTRTLLVNIQGQAQQGAIKDSGRERLKRHRVEVAGRVWIPDMWGQEELLKDWIDCSAFDASLMSGNIMLARAALVQEGRRANSSRLRI